MDMPSRTYRLPTGRYAYRTNIRPRGDSCGLVASPISGLIADTAISAFGWPISCLSALEVPTAT
jgi:hypothetical protein